MNTSKLQRQLAFETRQFNESVRNANVHANNIDKLRGSMMNYMKAAKKKADKNITATQKIKKPCKSRGYGMGRRGKCGK